MNQEAPVVVWINCYGGWDPARRHPIETMGYSQYLDGIVEGLATIKSRIAAIYISGGMVDALGQTECSTTGPELVRRLKQKGIQESLLYDEVSVTTPTIVHRWIETIRAEYPGKSTVLFCDEARIEINRNLAGYYAEKLGEDPEVWKWSIYGIDRPDITERSTKEYQATKWQRMLAEGVEHVENEEMALRIQAKASQEAGK